MTPEQAVFRSLGVPDSLQEKSRLPAAAHRLTIAASLDVAQSPRSQRVQARLEDAEKVVKHAVEVVASGELDGAIGGGYQDDDWYVSRITRELDLHVYENGRDCALALIRLLRDYVAERPFEDDKRSPVQLTSNRPARECAGAYPGAYLRGEESSGWAAWTIAETKQQVGALQRSR